MKVRLVASAVGCLSLVWVGIGLVMAKLALEPGGEPEDIAVVIVVIVALSVVGLALSTRTVVFRRGIPALGVFAAVLAGAAGLNSVIAPFAHHGPWTISDSVAWALGLANALVLALAGWTLCRRPA